MLFKPYGLVRWWTGTLETDYRFTGQRQDSYINMYEMGARWYDPYLNRWLSPDPIVPNPGNPQSLNRYSYGWNNPVKYVDPSGFDPCDADNTLCWIERWNNAQGLFLENGGWVRGAPYFADEKILLEMAEYDPSVLRQAGASIGFVPTNALLLGQKYGIFLRGQVEGGSATGLEALARLSEFASILFPNSQANSSGLYMNAMSEMLNGFSLGGFGLFASNVFGKGPNFIGFWNDSGFNQIYQDGTNSQPYHFWFFVQAGFYNGNNSITQGFAEYHERPGEPGASQMDLRLSYMGLKVGADIKAGVVNIAAMGDWIRSYLGGRFSTIQ